MGRGLLEVLLVDAKGLAGYDFLGKIDPYVVVQYRSQEPKSSTAQDEGRNPSWNDVFRFQINSTAPNVQHKLIFRIMDRDNFSSDDFLSEATVGMEKGTSELNLAKYRVVTAVNSYHGEIKVVITFTMDGHYEFWFDADAPLMPGRTRSGLKLEASARLLFTKLSCYGKGFPVASFGLNISSSGSMLQYCMVALPTV